MRSGDFERAADLVRRAGAVAFTPSQREVYRVASVEDLCAEQYRALARLIWHFLGHQVPRLRVLESYDTGDNAGIVSRPARKEAYAVDYRARHNFGGYIATFQNGYMFGIPVKVEHEDGAIKDVIDQFASVNSVDTINTELGYDCARFGRAYEMHYRDDRDRDRVALLDVKETFVVYDATVEERPLCAVRCVRDLADDTGMEWYRAELYTADEVIRFKPAVMGAEVLVPAESVGHLYGMVPIVEWRNNRARMGDYERVLSLIDLYDAAQSDTANYMHDLNDALLVISGDMESKKYTVEDLAAMKKANLMLLEGGMDMSGRPTSLHAEYLYKQYDVAGKEAYNKRLQDDIHKFTQTPDLSDDSFAGTQSGVALKYKLFGLEQIRSTKERYYTEALRQRYRVIASLRSRLGELSFDADMLTIIFTENLPEDEWSEIKDYYSCGGELSQRTLLERLSFVPDAQAELDRVTGEGDIGSYYLDEVSDGA